jgi:hypothetical protein
MKKIRYQNKAAITLGLVLCMILCATSASAVPIIKWNGEDRAKVIISYELDENGNVKSFRVVDIYGEITQLYIPPDGRNSRLTGIVLMAYYSNLPVVESHDAWMRGPDGNGYKLKSIGVIVPPAEINPF